MNRHALHYIDLHPEAVKTDDPSTLAIWAGAALAVLAIWAVTFLAFTL